MEVLEQQLYLQVQLNTGTFQPLAIFLKGHQTCSWKLAVSATRLAEGEGIRPQVISLSLSM